MYFKLYYTMTLKFDLEDQGHILFPMVDFVQAHAKIILPNTTDSLLDTMALVHLHCDLDISQSTSKATVTFCFP